MEHPLSANPQYDANELALLLGKPVPYPEHLTNHELMRFIFGERDTPERPFITAFAGHPKSDAARWGGVPWWRDNPCEFGQLNAYTTLATFRAHESSDPLVSPEWHRREADMAAVYGFMLDDLAEETWRKMLAPTWALETSRGNYQVVYLLREPCTDAATANRFCRAMVEHAGGDPNAKNPPTRWVRLPQAVNGKYDPPWRCRLRVFNPDALYTLEELAVKMDLQLGAEAAHDKRAAVDTSVLYGELAEVEALASLALPACQTREEWVGVVAAVRGATLHKPEAGLEIVMKHSWHDNEAQVQHSADTYWSFRANEVRSGIEELRRKAHRNPDPVKAFENIGRTHSEPAPMFYIVRDLPAELDARYIIKGLLDEGAFALIFGGSMAGKTFLVIDMALHLAAGRPWFGCRVASGIGVVLVANEGFKGAHKRLRAAARHHGIELDGLPLAVNNQGINLGTNRNLVQYRIELERAIRIVREKGARHVVVIFDTLATTWVGVDENDSAGLGAVIAQMNAMKAHVTPILVHHPGKDASKGPRGHSSLFAAADTVYRVQQDAGSINRTLTVDKQRDGECGVPYTFELERVNLGFDADGDARSTRVVRFTGSGQRQERKGVQQDRRVTLKGQPLLAYRALLAAVAASGVQRDTDTVSGRVKAVGLADWREAFYEARGAKAREERNSANTAFNRVYPDLIANGQVCSENGWFWLPD